VVAAGWRLRLGGRAVNQQLNFPNAVSLRVSICNVDAFFGEQQFSNLPPRLAPLAQLADEFKVWLKDAAEWFAATFSLCRFGHHWTEYLGGGKPW